jgi:hypothetical protein
MSCALDRYSEAVRRLVPLVTFTILAASVASACGDTTTAAPRHGGTYPGDVRSSGCASHWFVGKDEIARFSCSRTGYQIAFMRSGQESARTLVEPASTIRVDAVVQASSSGSSHLILDPGIGCYKDADHGWLAQLGSRSVFVIIAVGSSTPLTRGTSSSVHALSRRNHLVLTCDASGSQTRISLRVNGELVAHDVPAGGAVEFDRFGIWAAGEADAAMELRAISATTS